MVVIFQFSPCLQKLQWIMISEDECILPENVIPPLAEGFHFGVDLFVVIKVLMDDI